MRNKTHPRARKQKQVPANPNKGLTIKKHSPRPAGDKNALDGRSHRTLRGKLRAHAAEVYNYPPSRQLHRVRYAASAPIMRALE